jgi:hypothetical protein
VAAIGDHGTEPIAQCVLREPVLSLFDAAKFDPCGTLRFLRRHPRTSASSAGISIDASGAAGKDGTSQQRCRDDEQCHPRKSADRWSSRQRAATQRRVSVPVERQSQIATPIKIVRKPWLRIILRTSPAADVRNCEFDCRRAAMPSLPSVQTDIFGSLKCSIITTCDSDFAKPTSVSPRPLGLCGPARRSS